MRQSILLAALGTLASLAQAGPIDPADTSKGPKSHLTNVQGKPAQRPHNPGGKPKTTPNPLGVLWTGTPNPQSVCTGQTTLTSTGLDSHLPRALWSDCRAMHDEWRAQDTRGLFTITRPSGHPETDFYYPVLYHESCYLAISPGCDAAEVGDIDIQRVIHGALQQTSRGGTMAAEGEMMCRKGKGWGCIHGTKWRMYGDLDVEGGCKQKNGKKEKKKGKQGKKKDRRATRDDVDEYRG